MFFSLFYRRSFHLKENTPIALLPSFKTDELGSFNFSIISKNDESFFVGLTNASIYGKIWDVLENFTCNEKNHSSETLSFTLLNKTLKGTKKWNVSLPNNTILAPIIISCDKKRINLYAEASFMTNNHYSDYRTLYYEYTIPFRVSIPIFHIALIVITTTCGKLLYKNVHTVLLLACVCSFLLECLNVFNFYEFKYNGNIKNVFHVSSLVIDQTLQAFICISGYLISSGWSISTNDCSLWKVITIGALAVGTINFNYFSYWYEVKEFVFVPFLVQMLCLLIIANIIFTATQTFEINILAYEFIIKKVGIKPDKTPVHSFKNRSYVTLFMTMLFMIFRIINIMVTFFFSIDVWITDLVEWITNSVYVFSLILVSLPKGISKELLDSICRDENKLKDFNKVDLETENLPEKEPVDWVEGKPLPAPPIVSKIIYHLIIEETQESEAPLLTEPI